MWGKLIGAFFGALLAGPFGLLLGLFIGHAFDRGLRISHQFSGQYSHTHAQEVFFDATFSVMGHIAKADGYVSESEIHAAEAVMSRLNLRGPAKKRAIEFFSQGKQADFSLEKTLNELLQACQQNPALLQMFAEIQWQVAQADGAVSPSKKRLLEGICQRLGIMFYSFSAFEDFFRAAYQQQQHYRYQGPHTQVPPSRNQLSEAYKLLGIAEAATDVELKKAYRRLMSQNHPDKMIAQGLPEEMIKLATEKTQNIRSAYDLICKHRGI
jgi:DnaJ like chaperone protein